MFKDAVKAVTGRDDDEPPPPRKRKRGETDKEGSINSRVVAFAKTASGIMRAMSRGHAVQTQFAATAARSASRRNHGIGFVLQTFGADSTVSLSDPLGGMSFEGGDMGGFDSDFDAFSDHDLHAL